MSAESTQTMSEHAELVTAEHRLKELGITLPAPPEPFGTYAEAVQTSNLLFLTGMLPAVARTAKFIGRVGAELEPSFFRLFGQLETLAILFFNYHTDQSVCSNVKVVMLPPQTCSITQ